MKCTDKVFQTIVDDARNLAAVLATRCDALKICSDVSSLEVVDIGVPLGRVLFTKGVEPILSELLSEEPALSWRGATDDDEEIWPEAFGPEFNEAELVEFVFLGAAFQNLVASRDTFKINGVVNLCSHSIREDDERDRKRSYAIKLAAELLEFNDTCHGGLQKLVERQWFNCHANYSPEEVLIDTETSLPITFYHRVFDVASKMEHCCAPNVMVTTESGSIRIFAARDLSTGERLKSFYEGSSSEVLFYPHRDREAVMFDKWKFSCRCERCIGPDYTRPIRCSKCATGVLWSKVDAWLCNECGNSDIEDLELESYEKLETDFYSLIASIDDEDEPETASILKLIKRLQRHQVPGTSHMFARLYAKVLNKDPGHPNGLLFSILYIEWMELMYLNGKENAQAVSLRLLLDDVVINPFVKEVTAFLSATSSPTLRAAERARDLLVCSDHIANKNMRQELETSVERRYGPYIELWQAFFEQADDGSDGEDPL